MGFNDEFGKAFKSTTDAKGKVVNSEYAEIYAAEGSRDDDFVLAKFDGDEEVTTTEVSELVNNGEGGSNTFLIH